MPNIQAGVDKDPPSSQMYCDVSSSLGPWASSHSLLRYSQWWKYTCSASTSRPMTFTCRAVSCCGTATRLMQGAAQAHKHTPLLVNMRAVPRVVGLYPPERLLYQARQDGNEGGLVGESRQQHPLGLCKPFPVS